MSANDDLIQILSQSFTSAYMLRRMQREGSVWAEAGFRRTAAQLVADPDERCGRESSACKEQTLHPFLAGCEGRVAPLRPG